MESPRFIADVHLGKLARHLRMLGFDTLYSNRYTNESLPQLATDTGRILLSRNTAFTGIPGLLFLPIHSPRSEEQLLQVTGHYELKEQIRPFTRCLRCNGLLRQVAKDEVAASLRPQTEAYFNEFFLCHGCGQVYWKGSHHGRMLQVMERLGLM